jgi:hypothetical protein
MSLEKKVIKKQRKKQRKKRRKEKSTTYSLGIIQTPPKILAPLVPSQPKTLLRRQKSGIPENSSRMCLAA